MTRLQIGTNIFGNIVSSDSMYINGTFVGDINLSNDLVLGESADVTGNIWATNLTILGKVIGNLVVQGKVSFYSQSNFKGKLTATSLEVKNGAIFNADCLLLLPSNTDSKINTHTVIIPEEKIKNTNINDTSSILGNLSNSDVRTFFL